MASLLDLLNRRPPAPAGGSPALPRWARGLFESELAPRLADGGETLVWSIKDDTSTATITDQFKANAGDYHQRYAASDHFEKLFRQALAETGATAPQRPVILDLGSGSGVNSVAPCLRLFPGARIVATDLSAELLSILADYLRQERAADEVVCVQMDAMSNHVAAGAFDLVTGAAILHHLERPRAGLNAAARALKPGGRAIFFEPFDGWGVVRLAYERILAEARLRQAPLDPAVAQVLGAQVLDIAARTNPDPESPAFRALDDKWLFSRERIETAARAAGFAEVQIVPHNSQDDLYQLIVPIQLRLATGRTDLALPDWAMDILRGFDAALTGAVKRAAMLEGSIVLTKAG